MIEFTMDTALTAFRNGEILATCGYNPKEIESYRAVYIKTFENRLSERMRAAADRGFMFLIMAIEDAEADRIEFEARQTAVA